MDEQQGNVIDGTARARQWRRSRSKAAREHGRDQSASDAPKSIASSLLVPADMVPASASTAVGDKSFARDDDGPAAETASVTPGFLPSEGSDRRNPFLAGESRDGSTGGRGRGSARGRVLIARFGGWVRARPSSDRTRHKLLAGTPRRWLHALRRPVAVATGSVAAVALVTVLLAQSEAPNSRFAQSSGGVASGNSLDPFRSRPLTPANLFAARHPGRTISSRARRVPARRRSKNYSRRRSTSSAAAILARYASPSIGGSSGASDSSGYTPLSSGASSGASDSSSYASSGSTATPAPQPATSSGSGTTNSGSSTTRPAFGENGTLGPGHSPAS